MLKNKFLILLIPTLLMSGCSNNDQINKNDEITTGSAVEVFTEPITELNTDLELGTEQKYEITTSLTSTTTTTQKPKKEEPVEVVTPVSGGTVKMSMRLPKTLNPLINDDVTVDNALKLVFEPLFSLDTDNRVIPCLAKSYYLSENGLELTINLRDDIKWQDGKNITAEDVVFSLDTIKANPLSIYHRALTNLQSYNAVGSSTVILKYSGVYGACMYNLCFPIIPKHYYNGKNATNSDVSMNPMGSGLYRFESYQKVKKMTLSKSSNFKGTPYIDTVEFIITDNKETDLNAFEQKITDIITVDVSEWGKFNNSREAKSTRVNTNSFEFVGYNFNNSVFQNINIRKAIAYAIPTNEIVENIYLSNASASLVPVNPNSWLSAKDEIMSYQYNLQNAISLIRESGFTTEQLTFNLIVNEENNERYESARLIANALNQIGMKVTIVKMPFENYKEALDKDNFDLFVGGVKLSNTPDLRVLLSSSSRGESGINYTNFSDENMDYLLNETCVAIGEDNYQKSMKEVQKYCATQLPFVGILFKDAVVLTDKNIYGSTHPSADNSLNEFENWFIKK